MNISLVESQPSKKMVAFVCSICQRGFHNKSNLNRHTKMVHDSEEIEQMESEDSFDEQEENSNTDESGEDSEGEEYNEVEEKSIWTDIYNLVKTGNRKPLEAYKEVVVQAETLRTDPVHKKVMKTLKRYREEDDMDFEEALDKTIHKRRFLILREITQQHDEEEEEET